MKWVFSLLALGILAVARAQLTEDELQIFRDNGVTISDHQEEGFRNFQHNGIPDHDYGEFGDRYALLTWWESALCGKLRSTLDSLYNVGFYPRGMF